MNGLVWRGWTGGRGWLILRPNLPNSDRPMSRISAPERLARDLDWNLLRVFLALAEAGSVTGAAERLSLKQPSVSAALKRLEERVGARLIDRLEAGQDLSWPLPRLFERISTAQDDPPQRQRLMRPQPRHKPGGAPLVALSPLSLSPTLQSVHPPGVLLSPAYQGTA